MVLSKMACLKCDANLPWVFVWLGVFGALLFVVYVLYTAQDGMRLCSTVPLMNTLQLIAVFASMDLNWNKNPMNRWHWLISFAKLLNFDFSQLQLDCIFGSSYADHPAVYTSLRMWMWLPLLPWLLFLLVFILLRAMPHSESWITADGSDTSQGPFMRKLRKIAAFAKFQRLLAKGVTSESHQLAHRPQGRIGLNERCPAGNLRFRFNICINAAIEMTQMLYCPMCTAYLRIFMCKESEDGFWCIASLPKNAWFDGLSQTATAQGCVSPAAPHPPNLNPLPPLLCATKALRIGTSSRPPMSTATMQSGKNKLFEPS